jgi:hypothetical protein
MIFHTVCIMCMASQIYRASFIIKLVVLGEELAQIFEGGHSTGLLDGGLHILQWLNR